MKAEHGFDLPRRLQIEFSKTIQHITEDSGTEISPVVMWDAFQDDYLPDEPRFRLEQPRVAQRFGDGTHVDHRPARRRRRARTIIGEGNGPIDAFVHALRDGARRRVDVLDYAEHAIGQGSEANAVAYVETSEPDGDVLWGVGVDPNIITASLRAVLNAHERHQL